MIASGFPGTPQAAIDPIGFIVFVIIVVNVVSTFLKRARAQQSKQPDTQSSSTQLQEAMRKSSADLAAARTAQRAKLQQAIRAARQPQVATPARSAAPTVVASQAPTSMGGDWQIAPQALADLVQPSVLPSFELEAQLPPGVNLVASPQPSAQAPATKLPILRGKFTGADLFVATAVIGPCAALRTIGHTPAGW